MEKGQDSFGTKKMLDDEQPDLVVAFEGGRGTAHMIEYARRNNVPTVEPK